MRDYLLIWSVTPDVVGVIVGGGQNMDRAPLSLQSDPPALVIDLAVQTEGMHCIY